MLLRAVLHADATEEEAKKYAASISYTSMRLDASKPWGETWLFESQRATCVVTLKPGSAVVSKQRHVVCL
jgi:hypothetical protein